MRVNEFSLDALVEERRVAGEAADAAWRAWRYPLENRTASARGRPASPNLRAAGVEDREARAEAAWSEVMRRMPFER